MRERPDLGIKNLTNVDLIAVGSQSKVYRAWQEDLRRFVAIKVRQDVVDSETARRFEREAAAIGTLSGHPHVVPIYSVGLTSQVQPYMVLQYYENGSLADRILGDGPLSVEVALRVAVQIGSALHSAHSHGIVHGDVKPENILIDRRGNAALADFGIAAFGELDLNSTIIGFTPSYASPEILSGLGSSPLSDLYSLAATVWASLSGKPPYYDQSDSWIVVIRKVLESELPAMERLDVPLQLVQCLSRAMSKNPASRQPTVARFVEDVQNIQRELGLEVVEGYLSGPSGSGKPLEQGSGRANFAYSEPLLPAETSDPPSQIGGTIVFPPRSLVPPGPASPGDVAQSLVVRGNNFLRRLSVLSTIVAGLVTVASVYPVALTGLTTRRFLVGLGVVVGLATILVLTTLVLTAVRRWWLGSMAQAGRGLGAVVRGAYLSELRRSSLNPKRAPVEADRRG